MDWTGAIDALAREAMLFAAIGLLIGGIDDLAVDLLFLGRRWRRRHTPRLTLDRLPPPRPGRIVVFVPAWDEVAVIGAMLRTALTRWADADVRILVGTYPNDPATIAAARAVGEEDARVRVVVGARPGPTTKADCLNTLWRALADEAEPPAAVVLHDAEDVVHPAELRVFASLIEHHAVVQLPVVPLIDPAARLVSGCAADEFAESHGKLMVVRGAIGAGIPLAGTGCALAPAMLARLAAARDGGPFDADSWVEDYELGLRLAALGGRGIFARVDDGAGGIVAVRSLFPTRVGAAVRQKARWTARIALTGWDRIGWASHRAFADHWMRARDRRAPIAAIVLAAAYIGMVAWIVGLGLHAWRGSAHDAAAPATLLAANTLLLGWRAAMRAAFSTRAHGWREGLMSLPRLVVGNMVTLVAVPLAMGRYIRLLRGCRVGWDKTAHRFPDAATPGFAP